MFLVSQKYFIGEMLLLLVLLNTWLPSVNWRIMSYYKWPFKCVTVHTIFNLICKYFNWHKIALIIYKTIFSLRYWLIEIYYSVVLYMLITG